MAGFNDAPLIRTLAIPSVALLICFLSYFSQIVFQYSSLDPGPPSRTETYTFNILVLLLWITYYRAVTTDPGRFAFNDKVIDVEGKKWCKKCEAPKPPRAHHCRICGRCVPKMDHHCPWTGNCVSMTTFPHFLRFLLYANVSLWYLGHLLWRPISALWESRHLPAYLGPSLPGLISLALLCLVWFFTTSALGIILFTSTMAWVLNKTSIEGWELEKHESLMERSQRQWWDMKGPAGEVLRLEKTEFPYDIGFYHNMAQAMGSLNPLWWVFPLAGNPKVGPDQSGTGWVWPENGFNRREGMWPPVDPEKVRQARREWPTRSRKLDEDLKSLDDSLTAEERKQGFQRRQEHDARRRNILLDNLEEVDADDYGDSGSGGEDYEGHSLGKEWVNEDGDTLHDFGVDIDAEGDSITEDDEEEEEEEEVPLGELLRRRKAIHTQDNNRDEI